ncbi:MAG: NADH-quinone oxidoreductase subunit C [Ferrimicrobium sp.]
MAITHFVARDSYSDEVGALVSGGFHFLADLVGVDYATTVHPGLPQGVDAERFEVVVTVRNFESEEMLRVRVQVPEVDPRIDSIFRWYPGAEAMEREVYDLFGVVFVGHPDLSRILMPEDWEGHPLRKDYGLGGVPIQFKELRRNR